MTNPGRPLEMTRCHMTMKDARLATGAAPLQFLPPQCVLLTDAPELLASLGRLPPDLIVLSTQAPGLPYAVARHVSKLDETSVAALIPKGTRHVRVLTSLRASRLAPGARVTLAPGILDLHTLTFLLLKRCYGKLGAGSLLVLLLDALAGNLLHPDAGLFTGLVKVMRGELPTCRSLVLCTVANDAAPGVAEIERETGRLKPHPVVALNGPIRQTPGIVELARNLPCESSVRIGRDSVVVAFGNACGMLAELMKALGAEARPTLYMIGGEARHTLSNIELLRRWCGTERVHYLCADTLDPASVRRAVEQVLARESRVDLVVNGIGLHCRSPAQVKSLSGFMAVRDAKVRGYGNVRAAFGASQPRAWCNLVACTGLMGRSGETDYASATDFLGTHACWNRAVRNEDEFTVCWKLLRQVQLGKRSRQEG